MSPRSYVPAWAERNAVVTAGFAVVVDLVARSVARVSLNRCEQRLFDYLHAHKEERQFWEGKLRTFAKNFPDEHVLAARLEAELWRYYTERAAVAVVFKEAVRHEGLGRTSMRNLAELLMRLWLAPRPTPGRPKQSEVH